MSNYNTGGDYNLKELTLTNFRGDSTDITSLFMNIEYTESIFHSTVFGTLLIADAVDMVQLFPIIGQEKLKLRYTTYNDSTVIEKEFFVYRISPKVEETQQSSIYTLFLTSRETLVDQNTRVSKSFQAKSTGEIVTGLFKKLESEKSLFKTETSGKHNVIIPNWNPIEAINWTRKFAQPRDYGSSYFLFYENSNGFNYRHVEELIEQESILDAKPYLANAATGGSDGQIRPGNSIIDSRIIKTGDTLSGISKGLYAGRTISYDNVTKNIAIQDHDYKKLFGKTKHTMNFPLVSDDFEFTSKGQHINVVATTSNRDNSSYFGKNEGSGFSRNQESVSVNRASIHSQITANQIAITMYGNTEMTAGININVSLKNNSAIKDASKRDGQKYIDGKVLVAECQHILNRGKHMMEIVVLSDSLKNQPEHDYRN